MLRHALSTVGFVAATSVVLAASPASARDPDGCVSFDVDYATASNLQLRNTRLGAADGVYPSGTGTMRLRIEGAPGAPAHAVRLLSYDNRGRISIVTHALLWTTTVVTDARNTVRSAGDQGAARGTLRDGVVSWSTKVTGYRSDGTMTCDGTMCGRFGAPPPGSSPLHDGPYDIDFRPFVFSHDMRTFTMDYALVSRAPEQTSYVSISGREVSRTCVRQ